MAVNNETGVIQDIPRLAAIAREAGALFHSDLAQAAGKIPVDVTHWGVEPGLGERAQAVRAEGGGCAVRAPAAAGAGRATLLRRRAGTRIALRHVAGAADRGFRGGVPDCRRRDGG